MIKFLLFIIIMCVLCMLLLAFVNSVNKVRRAHVRSKNYDPIMLRERGKPAEPDPLLQLSKEDYDFMRDNGVETTQAVHDHFYPPGRLSEYDVLPTHQPLDRWGANAIDFEAEAKARLAREQQRGIDQQKQALKIAKERRRELDYNHVTVDQLPGGGSIIRVGTPPRAIVMDVNGVKPVQEWKPWIDTERIKG